MTPEERTKDIEELAAKKKALPPGPWHNEPDRVDFTHAGFDCFLHRSPLGAWCGYVGVPPGHALHGKDYNDVDVEVHGGLTYGEACFGSLCHVPRPGEPAELWWFGFDCGHCWDLVPGMPMTFRSASSLDIVYRDLAYVRAETESLAEQIAGTS